MRFKPAEEIETTGLLPFNFFFRRILRIRFEPEFEPIRRYLGLFSDFPSQPLRPFLLLLFLRPLLSLLSDTLSSTYNRQRLLLLVELADQFEPGSTADGPGRLLQSACSSSLVDLDLDQPLLLIEEAEGLSKLGLQEGKGEAKGPEAAFGQLEPQVERDEEGQRGEREGGGQGWKGQESVAV